MNRLSPDQADLRLRFEQSASDCRNLTEGQLYEEAIRRGEGTIAGGGAFAVTTGEHTGRSPNDKFIVDHASYRADVDWGKASTDRRRGVRHSAPTRRSICKGARFSWDCHAGADPAFRLPIRITETAWHNLFARNMPIQPPAAELAGFESGSIIQVLAWKLAALRTASIPAPLCWSISSAAGADRRHLVRRRDQKIGVRHFELPAAGPRRAADALLGWAPAATRRSSSACRVPAKPPCRPMAHAP